MNKMSLGGGGRFAAIERSAAASGARNPAAVAAAAGRAKYGNEKMAQLSAKGRKRHKGHSKVAAALGGKGFR
jgi:hypothetical protein